MNKLELQLLKELAGDESPVETLRSDTRIDTGLWWRKKRLWVCITREKMILLSVTKRRFVEQLDLSDIAGTYYNHATGELVIEPNEGLRLNALKFSARDALTILNYTKPVKAATVV